jgi:hypothetical protein
LGSEYFEGFHFSAYLPRFNRRDSNMDDLKIVFYIIVAIVWMVYNNYRKLSEQSSKRDPSAPPPGDVIEENWPKEPPVARKPEPTVIKKPSLPKVLRKREVPVPVPVRTAPSPMKRAPLYKERLSSSKSNNMFLTAGREGGAMQPSKMVQFEEPHQVLQVPNPWAEAVRNADFRTAMILSEVLKRPYN